MPSTLEIYEHLKPKLGEQETRELLEWIESEKTHLTTKADLSLAESNLRKDMESMRIELKKDMESMKVELLKWIFASWLTLVLAIIGLYLKR